MERVVFYQSGWRKDQREVYVVGKPDDVKALLSSLEVEEISKDKLLRSLKKEEHVLGHVARWLELHRFFYFVTRPFPKKLLRSLLHCPLR